MLTKLPVTLAFAYCLYNVLNEKALVATLTNKIMPFLVQAFSVIVKSLQTFV